MSIQGIDVSGWQPSDFHLLPGAGYDFVIIKATEGVGFKDGSFDAKWAAAKAAGLLRGAYHFARPDLGNDPHAEAQWFLKVVASALEPHDFLAYDLEKGGGDLSGVAQRFLDDVAAAVGFNPMLYANLDYLRNHGLEGHPGLGRYGLWLADWVPSASGIPSIPGWPFVAIWQNGSAVVPGFPGAVDHDIFFGSRAQLIKYGKPAPPPPPPDPRDVEIAGLRAQLAAAQSQVLTLTQQRDAALQRITAAKAALG